MCAEPALRIDMPTTPENGGAGQRESASPENEGDRPSHAQLSGEAPNHGQAALRKRERELREIHAMPPNVIRMVRQPRAESGNVELNEDEKKAAEPVDPSKVITLKDQAERWEAELKALEGRDWLTFDQKVRMEWLKPRLVKYAKMEEYFESAQRLEALERQLKELTEHGKKDKERLLRLGKLRDEANEEAERLRTERKKKEELVKSLDEAADTIAKGKPSFVRGEAKRARQEINELDVEIEQRTTEVEEHRLDRKNVYERMSGLPQRIAELRLEIEAMRRENLKHGADVAMNTVEMEEEPAAPERWEEGREEVRFEGIDPSSFRPLAGTKEKIGKAARKVGRVARPVAKPAAVVGAVGLFGAFGGFGKIGNFVTTWGRRLSNPHRFWDDFIKRVNENFVDPPKGKGFGLGLLSTAGWLLFGETKLAPHDRTHRDMV